MIGEMVSAPLIVVFLTVIDGIFRPHTLPGYCELDPG